MKCDGKYRVPWARFLGLITLLIAGNAAFAQQEEGGLLLTFDIGVGLEANDNEDLDPVSSNRSTELNNTLSFGLISRTRTQTFELGLDGILRATKQSGQSTDFGFENPAAQMLYRREAANSLLTADLSYSEFELSSVRAILDEGLDPSEAIVVDSGRRQALFANAMLETGMEAPLGFVLDIGFRDIDYTDTTDPSLFASTTHRVSSLVRLQLTERTNAQINYAYRLYEEEDPFLTSRTTQSLSFGVEHEVSPITVLSASVGATDITETFGVALPDNNHHGLIAEFSLMQELPAGSFGLSFDHQVETTGERSTFQAERGFEWPTGQLVLEAGVVNNTTGDLEPIGSLEFVQEMPRGQFTANVSRRFFTDANNQDLRITSAGVGYNVDVNDLSQLRFGMNFTNVKDQGIGTGDSDRVDLTAEYTREITEGLALSVGYGHEFYNTETTNAAHNNRVFLNLVRHFEFRR